MTSTLKAHEAVARADDLRDLLDHIAWTDTILPRFDLARTHYQRMLVSSVLGNKLEFTSEQIAGRIDGLNFVEALFKDILTKGEKAFVNLNPKD